MADFAPAPWSVSEPQRCGVSILDAEGMPVAEYVSPDDAPLLAAAPDLRDLATLIRDMRAAQNAYYAKRVPPAEKRDLLIASRELEVKVDRATKAVLAKIGGAA